MSERPKRIDVGFIRLLFTETVQEEVALQWAERLALVVGAEVLNLRPETCLAEILKWAVHARVDSMDFVVVFEPELGMDFAWFLDEYETVSFREMVEYCARRIRTRKWLGT